MKLFNSSDVSHIDSRCFLMCLLNLFFLMFLIDLTDGFYYYYYKYNPSSTPPFLFLLTPNMVKCNDNIINILRRQAWARRFGKLSLQHNPLFTFKILGLFIKTYVFGFPYFFTPWCHPATDTQPINYILSDIIAACKVLAKIYFFVDTTFQNYAILENFPIYDNDQFSISLIFEFTY